ncbi:hypothetical protein [Streptomyces monomycini]|uniref:hypothetical protein n=1 Tax=Streptomyces monomycini TaxID=371720 RepID=UPI000ABA7924|nr:hypothetical protein [Streptomyces monomycini]
MTPEPHLSPEFNEELQTFLSHAPNDAVKRTCAGAVRLAELRRQTPAAVPDLPDLYEPLVLFYERGGEFVRDNAGFLDLTGVLFRPGTLEGHLGTPPLEILSSTVLDAVDAEGRISYYTEAHRQGPLLRRRKLRSEQHDEAFDRSARWVPTDRIPDTEPAVKESGLVELDEMVAANLIGATVVNAAQ